MLTGSFASAAEGWNLPLVPWTVNDVDDVDRLIREFELDGINTDYPDRLIDDLERQ